MSADGKWKVTMNTPMGAQEVELDFKTEGSVLTGTVSGRQGSQPVQEGSVDGDNLAWKVEINGPMGQMTLTSSATVDGDSISGEVQLGSFGKADFTGARV